MKNKKIPTKNYIIYSIIVVVTLVLVFYANEWFKAYKEYELENSYISKYVTEINYNEFENFIQENTGSIVYISKTNSEASLKIEKDLYKILDDNEIVDKIVFLNLTNQENIIEEINRKYNLTLNKKIDKLPAIVIFENNRIVDILMSDEDEKIYRSDILKLLEGQEYIK